nr:hypothetical protein [Corynebacterium lactis]
MAEVGGEDGPAVAAQLRAEPLPDALDLARSVQKDDRPGAFFGDLGAPIVLEDAAQRAVNRVGDRCGIGRGARGTRVGRLVRRLLMLLRADD